MSMSGFKDESAKTVREVQSDNREQLIKTVLALRSQLGIIVQRMKRAAAGGFIPSKKDTKHYRDLKQRISALNVALSEGKY